MKNIISGAVIDDWRKYFILYPEIIEQCGKSKFTRHEDSDNILLMEKIQTNGNHREYYSFAFFIRLQRMKIRANYIPSNSVDYLKYISQINGKNIEVSYAAGDYLVKLKKGNFYF